MKPNTSGSSVKEVKNGIDVYLDERLSDNEYTVDYDVKKWWFGWSPISSSKITSEIYSDRPLIISMSSKLGGSDHFVVGYGCQNYTYLTGEGTYSGYIVHYGWTDYYNVWINSSWCDGYVSLKINHTHNYRSVGQIGSTDRIEYMCTRCCHRTDAAINMYETDSYIERVATILQNGYQDYYVTFKTGGNKLFQTFGPKDVKLYLFDTEKNQLAYNDDSGYRLNSLFNYTVEAYKAYILRVQFYNPLQTGSVKIGITPTNNVYSEYEEIWHCSYEIRCTFTSSLNTTLPICYIPETNGAYQFNTLSYDNIDTCLYIIDPESTNMCLFDDDSFEGLQALIQTDLVDYRRYFIILSAYDITTRSGNMGINIIKII